MDKKKLLITGFYVEDYPRHKVLIQSLKKTFAVKERNFRNRGIFSFFKEIKHAAEGMDYVFVPNSSYKLVFLVIYLRLFTKTKIIYDAFISFYDTFVSDRKKFGKFSPQASIIYLIDLFVCWSAHILIFDTEEHKQYFRKFFGISKKKKQLIWPVALDLEIIDNPRTIFKEGIFNIFFYGTYIPLQGIEYIVEAAKELKEVKDIQFILLGDGQERKNIELLVKEYRLKNIKFLEKVNYAQLMQYIKKADVCLGIFGTGEKAKRVIPNKVLECIANEKIVITGKNLALEKYFTDKKEIVYCKLGDGKDLAEKINYVYKHFHELIGMLKPARYKVEKHFSADAMVRNIEKGLYE